MAQAKVFNRHTLEQALDLVTAFYPDRLIEPKTRFGLEEIFDKLSQADKPSAAGPATL